MKIYGYTLVFVMGAIGAFYLTSVNLENSTRTPASDRTPSQAVSCKYEAYDLKKSIVGMGANIHAARADASQKCFDVRMHALESRSAGNSDFYERGLINIDECVNIRCS